MSDAADLGFYPWGIPVEVDAVQALDVQHRMTIEQFGDRDHVPYGDRLRAGYVTVSA